MNRLEDVISGVYDALDGNVSEPVRSGTRNQNGELWQPPYVRIEKPIIEHNLQNQTHRRTDVSLLVNAFSEKAGYSEIFKLEQEIRDALNGASLTLDSGRRAMLKPREDSSTPQTNEKEGREIHQIAVEFDVRISESV